MHITEEKLKEIISSTGIIDDEKFNSAKEEADRMGQEITEVLIGRGDITESYLAEILAPHFGVPLITLQGLAIPIETLEMIEETYAKAKGVIIFEAIGFSKGAATSEKTDEKAESNLPAEKRILKVAMLDPNDLETIEFLRLKFNAQIEVYLTTREGIKYAMRGYKKTLGKDFNEVIAENVKMAVTVSGEADITKMAATVPIVTILNSIIEYAVSFNASDIHFEPFPKEVLVRFRIDGSLQEMLSLNNVIAPILVARVKILADLQIDEHRVPQDGRFRFSKEDELGVIDVRVNVMPVMHGEKVEMRLLKTSARPLSLEELGVSQDASKIIQKEIKKPHGMILVTGPTGHGKTTTLYAILHILNTSKVNITTIEDPIEYEIQHINQTQVNQKAGITFANGLRSLLRQNPDIIMVGEIRDNDTVEISVHASLTGHLILSTLHTNDAPSALPRLLDMGAPAFLISSTVNLVIAQRLVRRICTNCIESYKMTPEIEGLIKSQLKLVNDTHIQKLPNILYRGKGCNICGDSGFQGQIAIFELLRMSENIRSLILKESQAGEIRKTAISEGMVTMFEDGLHKVEKGITTIEEVLRVVRE